MDKFAKKATILNLRSRGINIADITRHHYPGASVPHSTFICKIQKEDYFLFINCLFDYPQNNVFDLLEKDIKRFLLSFNPGFNNQQELIDFCDYQLEDKIRFEEKIGFSFCDDLYDFVDQYFKSGEKNVVDFLKDLEELDISYFFTRLIPL